VGLSYVLVGGVSVKTMTLAVFDTGTTYTYLTTAAYTSVLAVVRPVLLQRLWFFCSNWQEASAEGRTVMVRVKLEECFISVELDLLCLFRDSNQAVLQFTFIRSVELKYRWWVAVRYVRTFSALGIFL
jgi:hypothetical protein